MMYACLREARWKITKGVYLDDATIGNILACDAWEDTVECLKCLLKNGLPINIWKCQFLNYQISLLGFALTEDKLQLGKKSVKKLFQASLPKTIKGLMRILGMLNFCGPFILDYKRQVAPIVELMSSKSDKRWTVKHTVALNNLVELIWHSLTIHLVDPSLPAKLHCDSDDQFCSVVLTQQKGEVP